MANFISALLTGKLWDFHGGIHPLSMKQPTSHIPISRLPLAESLWLPLQQHAGLKGELLVKQGDYVLKGQSLTEGQGRALPIHAPTSGTINAIEPYTVAHPSGLKELSIQLVPDGLEIWIEKQTIIDYSQYSAEQLIERIRQAGIAGLGGAGFPTASKLTSGLHRINTLIINAAECEPYITADDRLMRERSEEIILGCQILQYILQPKMVIIGIEDNKPEAIATLQIALQHVSGIILRIIPTKYPSGGAKQLTKILTGLEVPYNQHSASVGILMQNIGTVYAIKRAIIDGEPLIERVVTITGNAIKQKGNLLLPLGTPVKHILAQCGYTISDQQTVIMGGPLTGFTLPHLEVPIVKISNCILVPDAQELAPSEPELACIRCGRCTDVCPVNLLPQQLYWFSRGKEHEKARQYNLFDCIECGSCAYVCPSNIPLVEYYRQEKAEIKALDSETRRVEQAKLRFEAKQTRIEREKAARQLRHQQAAITLNTEDNQAVQAALARILEKQQKTATITALTPLPGSDLPDNRSVIAAREARKIQARLKQAEKQQQQAELLSSEDQSVTQSNADPRKAAVAAAIARAQARKQAQQQMVVQETSQPITQEDPRKVTVTEAIARAKAKKAAQTASVADVSDIVETTLSSDDKRKQAVAAAIARAQARKQAQQQIVVQETPQPITQEDPRKVAVTEAIARAKAKKAAQTASVADVSDIVETTLSSDDKRKQAVAAAIARAQARKQAQQQIVVQETPQPITQEDPRKVAVTEAIARAKAKKAAQTASVADVSDIVETTLSSDDKRKQAVAVAIARAQTRKQAQQQMVVQETLQPVPQEDPRKVAVAEAIARAKAKKAAMAAKHNTNTSSTE